MKNILKVAETFLKPSFNKLGKFQYSKLVRNASVKQVFDFNSLRTTNHFDFSKKVVNVPTMGDSITEGVVFEFKQKVGEYINADEILAVVQTDKVKVDIRSPEAGQITKLYANQGDTILVAKELFEIDTAAPKPAGGPAPAAAPAPKPAGTSSGASTPAPAAPKSETPQTEAAAPAKQDKPAGKAAPPPPPVSFPKGTRNERREKMSKMREKIAQRLKDAQNTYALLTTFQEVDMGNLIDLRAKHQKDFEKKHGVKLGFMSFFIKASVLGLKEQPVINAVINGKEIVYRDYVDISIAVATPSGLMVPVLRNCEEQNFAQIEQNILALAVKGQDGTISMEDMAGGTFTISNGGVFGSLMGTPILNPPQSAILGMHATINRPVVRGENIVARPMMYLALTYDHRIIDGREAATFLKKIQAEIQDPTRLPLEI